MTFIHRVSVLSLLLACGSTRPRLQPDSVRAGGGDALVFDTDGDGLDDYDEGQRGTDPLLPDTDGDGYSDFEEVHFGSDPLDAESGVYAGGWPYNTDKDGLEARLASTPGDWVPRMVFPDQHGEMLDFYDFAGNGKPILVIFTDFADPEGTLQDELTWNGERNLYSIVEGLEDEEIWVVTIALGPYVTVQGAGALSERYPAKRRALVDGNDVDVQWANLNQLPMTFWVDDDMSIVSGDPESGITGMSDLAYFLYTGVRPPGTSPSTPPSGTGACGPNPPIIESMSLTNGSSGSTPAMFLDLLVSHPDGDLAPEATLVMFWDTTVDGVVDTDTGVTMALNANLPRCGAPELGLSTPLELDLLRVGGSLPYNTPVEWQVGVVDNVGTEQSIPGHLGASPVVVACTPHSDGSDATASGCGFSN